VYATARTLQFLGLVVTGVGLFAGLGAGNVRRELLLLVFGASLFLAGRWIQSRAGGE
jgi:hypothetical protein